MRSKLDWALHWAARGFAVFPCEEGGKAPATPDGFKSGTRDHRQITAWWRRNPDYNIGLWMKGHTLIDVDIKNGQDGLASLLDLELNEPKLAEPTLTVRTPSGGLHLYYTSEDSRNSSWKLGPGIDTRGHRGYALAPGSELDASHAPYDGPYTLEVDAPVRALPPSIFAQLARPVSEIRQELAASDHTVDVQAAREYLETASPAIEGAGGDNTTYRVVCAVRDFGVSEQTAFELMLEEWNERCEPPWSVEELRLKVSNAYRYAENTVGAKSVADTYSDLEFPPEQTAPPMPFRWAGHMPTTEASWLVYEKIPRSGTGMIVAPSRAGKTFFALKLAECLASGEPFFQEKPDEVCGTLILSAEGNHGLGRRLGALQKLPIAGLAIGALDTPQAVRALVKDIARAREEMRAKFNARLGLVVLDTLSASLLVQDENSNSDMARAFAQLTRISEQFGCLVLATHHTPKNSTGARGAGASFNAVDLVIEIFRKDEAEVRTVECMKNKEGPEGKWGSFTLQTVTIGYDARQRPKTTCLVSMGGIPIDREEDKPVHFDLFMQAFEVARVDNGMGKGEPVSHDKLSEAFASISPVKSARQTFARIFKYAVKFRLVYEEAGLIHDAPPALAPEL